MYTIEGVPNIVLSFFYGVFVDNFGICRGLLLFSLTQGLGVLTIFLGVLYKEFLVMLLGRFFLGIGSSGVTVAVIVSLTIWFPKRFGLAFTLALSSGRVCDAL